MGCIQSKNKEKKIVFKTIKDKYETYEQLQTALRNAGLESSNLIIAIDYTKSNTWTGAKTFNNKCLHQIDPTNFIQNPYQQVVTILGKTLEVFDDDKLIPAYGFGDSITQDKSCFSFFSDGTVSYGFQQVLTRYNEITPLLTLSGPTNFGPVIREAIRIVQEQRSYHILLIIADGQVSNEIDTKNAIVEASNYPISIIQIGVGDGPFDMMKKFDDHLPTRKFDNFQFVEFSKIFQVGKENSEIEFATAALMEIPDQYTSIRKLGYLN